MPYRIEKFLVSHKKLTLLSVVVTLGLSVAGVFQLIDNSVLALVTSILFGGIWWAIFMGAISRLHEKHKER